MMNHFILATAILMATAALKVQGGQSFIKEIKEGSYQNYSGQPLVDLGGKFYYFETYVATTWAEATLFCRNLGLYLVSIEDATENELIKDYILTNIGTTKIYWTSGSDSTQENLWVWTSTGRPIVFTDWHTGEPNNFDGIEDVIAIAPYQGSLKWMDFDGNTVMYSIYACCEQEA